MGSSNGIRANSVLPGWVESDMTAPAFGWDAALDAAAYAKGWQIRATDPQARTITVAKSLHLPLRNASWQMVVTVRATAPDRTRVEVAGELPATGVARTGLPRRSTEQFFTAIGERVMQEADRQRRAAAAKAPKAEGS